MLFRSSYICPDSVGLLVQPAATATLNCNGDMSVAASSSGEGCGRRRGMRVPARGIWVGAGSSGRGEHEREERGERKTTGGAYPVEGKGKDAHTEIQSLQVGPYTRQIRASRRIGQDSGFVRIVIANIQYREL